MRARLADAVSAVLLLAGCGFIVKEGIESGSRVEVVVEPVVERGFVRMYEEFENEFVLCLRGAREGDRVRVWGAELADMTRYSPVDVEYKRCRGNGFVGTAHNHIIAAGQGESCRFSDVDEVSFMRDELAQVEVVICRPDRFIWRTKGGDRGEVEMQNGKV